MIRISKIILYAIFALLLLWQAPWCYNFFISNTQKNNFTLYSSIYKDFIYIDVNENKRMIGRCDDGSVFTREQTDSLLPFFYVRQLISDNRFPKTINGKSITPHEIQMSNFNFRITSSEINLNKIGLYPLLESMSGRVELEMPDDVFRINKEGIEFIDIKSNTINEDKSQRFTKALTDKGFKFPATNISGNPTTRKDYDNGYLLTDSKGNLFHMKRMVGRPYVRHIDIPKDVHIKNVFITEFRDRKTLGFIVDENNNFYVLTATDYQLHYTGIDKYIPEENSISILGNMMDWTIWINDDNNIYYYALDAQDYTIIKNMIRTFDKENTFGLRFTSFKDKYVKPRFSL